MIHIKLNKEAMLSMYFDDVKGGRSGFSDDGIALLTESEFEDFLRANNLITYHNQLKTYDDGEVHGEFTID